MEENGSVFDHCMSKGGRTETFRLTMGRAYGLAAVWPDQIQGHTRVANPSCFPAATLTALAPLLANKLIEHENIIIDAKTGISGASRGGGNCKFGYAEGTRAWCPTAC
jgi:N-acetyl-gamma-glutamyl-phosphate reductase